MYEQVTRKFYPENEHEEIDIHNLRKLIRKMDGCVLAHILGEGDYHYIEAVFHIQFSV